MERTASGRGGEGLSLMRFDVSTSHEAAEEFTLPDYMPEVRRIVSCSAHVLPENKYLSPGAVELSGIVACSVLYIGDDGALSCAPLNSEYTAKIACPSDDGDEFGISDVGTYTTVESVICRATGPRRLSLTSRMRSRAFSVRREPTAEKVTTVADDGEVRAATAAENISLERHKTDVAVSMMSYGTVTGSVSGELREREGSKMILCTGSAGVKSASVENGGVTVRGEAYLSCLMLTPEGTYSSARVKVPFEEHVQSEALPKISKGGAAPLMSACSAARVASASAVGDESGTFRWEMEYDIDTEVVSSEVVSVTDDAYSTEFGCRITTAETETVSEVCCGVSSLTVYGSKQVTGGGGRSVPYSAGRASFDRVEAAGDGRLALIGACTVSAVTVGDGEAAAEDVVIPVRLECDGRLPDGANSGVGARCVMSVDCTDARLDGDKLTVTAELSVSYSVTAKRKVKLVSEAELDRSAPVGNRQNSVVLCFPEEGESRWSVGKRYRCSDGCIHSLEGSGAYMISPER